MCGILSLAYFATCSCSMHVTDPWPSFPSCSRNHWKFEKGSHILIAESDVSQDHNVAIVISPTSRTMAEKSGDQKCLDENSVDHWTTDKAKKRLHKRYFNKNTPAKLLQSIISNPVQFFHLTTLLFICRIKSRPSYLLANGSILILKATVRTISNFIMLLATTNLRELDNWNEGNTYLAEGMTARNTSGTRVIGQVLVRRWSSTTCVTTVGSVSWRDMRPLNIPQHHEVTTISSICGHVEL